MFTGIYCSVACRLLTNVALAITAAISGVSDLPVSSAMIVVRGRHGSRLRAEPAFRPPLDGQPIAKVGLHRLAAGLMPVSAGLAGNQRRASAVRYCGTISAPIVGMHLRPEHQLKFITPWRWRTLMATNLLAQQEHALSATGRQGVISHQRVIYRPNDIAWTGDPSGAHCGGLVMSMAMMLAPLIMQL